MNRGPGWNGVGDSARCLHFLQCLQPAVSNSDIEAFVDQADVSAHNSRHQDVADAIVNCVLVRHPALLDKVTLHTDLGGDRSHEGSEEHTSELQSLMRSSYAVFCLKKKNKNQSYQTSATSKQRTA